MNPHEDIHEKIIDRYPPAYKNFFLALMRDLHDRRLDPPVISTYGTGLFPEYEASVKFYFCLIRQKASRQRYAEIVDQFERSVSELGLHRLPPVNRGDLNHPYCLTEMPVAEEFEGKP